MGILGVCKGEGDFPRFVMSGATAGSIVGEVTIVSLLGVVVGDVLETSDDDHLRVSGEWPR